MYHQKKKYLGQHFLHEKTIAKKVADSLQLIGDKYHTLLEIGPGEGSLTQFLMELNTNLHLIEIDTDLIAKLKDSFPTLADKIFNVDFLKLDLRKEYSDPIGIIGNYPYNISSQILIKVIENRDIIPEMVGMFQKEVAERVTAKPGSKTYGRISVMVNAFFHTEYLFTVSKGVFTPPPKVESAVIRLTRKENFKLDCREKLFTTIVAAAFSQRRKTIRKAIKPFLNNQTLVAEEYLQNRAEKLSVEDFVNITNSISKNS